MKVCPSCGHNNREGLLFCEDCGLNLATGGENVTISTRQFNKIEELAAKATWGTAHFKLESTVVLHIRDMNTPLTLKPARRVILGRKDNINTNQPDVDLTPYGGIEKGVSRIHATIERGEDTLTITDMGSSNGTHLNGQKLGPDQPRVLRDGDEIRLGKLVAHIFFK